MKAPRIFFGASAILFGVIGLLWHDAETWQNVHALFKLPLGADIAVGLMILQIAGGLGIQIPRAVRPAAVLLCFVYICFMLACVPAIVAAPADYGSYPNFFEQLSILCGALALYAATHASTPSPALGLFARLGFGISTVSFAATQIFYFRFTVAAVPRWIPPNQKSWAILTTIAFGLAALAILINQRARLALRLTALMTALFGTLVWVPQLIAHPKSHFSWSEFALTLLITGAAWLVTLT
ncbi:MAG TPA: hypothetical protein VMI10_06120 [Terriglobales bacterium]|nr:hypothetical protein [Terriglobales bacterium]